MKTIQKNGSKISSHTGRKFDDNTVVIVGIGDAKIIGRDIKNMLIVVNLTKFK